MPEKYAKIGESIVSKQRKLCAHLVKHLLPIGSRISVLDINTENTMIPKKLALLENSHLHNPCSCAVSLKDRLRISTMPSMSTFNIKRTYIRCPYPNIK